MVDQRETPDLDTVEQPRGVESQWLLARAQARLLAQHVEQPIMVGRYRITRKLGAGGMAIVYAAQDEELDREIAIKLLQSSFARSDDWRLRLRREAQAMAKLDHPNVAHVYEVGQHADQLYIAMELIKGVTLRRWAEDAPRGVAQIIAMHLQAARGLAAAHAVGLVHRDYKPDNVIVDLSGRARVLDFGLARRHDEQLPIEHDRITASPVVVASTQTGTVMGTPAYMAPEQLAGRAVDHRADQFAFCVALFEALYGQRPFSGGSLTELAASISRHELKVERRGRRVPPAVDAAVRRGLEERPERRFADMEALIEVLAPYSATRTGRRASIWIAAALAGAAATTAGLVMMDRPRATIGEPTAAETTTDPWAEIVAGSRLPATIETALADDPAKVTIHRLRNGLTIYIAPKPRAPQVEAAVIVRADSTHEAADQVGVAALMRELIGDSDRLGSLDPQAEAPLLARQHAALDALSRTVDATRRAALVHEAVSAEAEARPYFVYGEWLWLSSELGFGTPWHEHGAGTVLACTVPRNRLDAWATITAEGLRRPSFRMFLSRLRGEIESRRKAADDAARGELERGISAWTGMVLDDASAVGALRTIPFAAMRRFWASYYRPNNTAIVLVGDVSAAEVVPLLEQAFGDWTPAPLPAPPHAALAGTAPSTARVIVDDGPARVLIAWPRTAEAAGLQALLRRSELARRWLATDGRATWLAPGPQQEHHVHPHYLELAAAPAPGRTHADAEAALRSLLHAIADDEISAAEWETAEAEAQLESLSWGTSTYLLALEIGRSFARGIEWRDHLPTLRGDALDRATIRSAAQGLIDKGGVVVHHVSGAPAAIELASLELPKPNAGTPATGHSSFARALLDAPTTPIEPQLLRPGIDLHARAWGNGRVITVPDDGPIFEVRIVWPFGVADDPFVCDAWRARIAALARAPAARGLGFVANCRAQETAIDVRGVSARLDATWPTVRSLFDAVLDDDDARRHVAEQLAERAHVRADDWARLYAFHSVALRGEQGIDARLPDDATLRRAEPELLRRALQRSLQTAPDFMYAGPHADDIVDRLGPPPEGPAHAPRLVQPRALASTTVFVLDDPTRTRADVRVTVATGTSDLDAMLLGDLMRAIRPDSLPLATHEPVLHTAMPIGDGPNADGILRQDGIECAPRDVAAAIEMLLGSARQTPTPETLARARTFVESELRSRRRSGLRAAIWMSTWAALDQRTDPTLPVWLGLGDISDDAIVAYHREVDAMPAVITVVADLERIPAGALERFGPVVRMSADAIRDPKLTELSVFGFYPPGVP
ncbi:MAG TPA: protein kinase [Nannocystaceae bacterium]|nr:protein kinase [Nannocystaceae bacterium]